MTRSVVTVTFNPTIDVDYTVDRLVPDDKLVARDHRRDPGGGGVNVSRALRCLGVDSCAWLVAGGATGDELVAGLRAEGLDPVVHRVAPPTRESVAIRDLATGAQYRVVVEGNEIDSAPAIESLLHTCESAGFVVLSGLPPVGFDDDVYARLVTQLAPATVLVDTFGASLPAAVEAAPAVVKPSRRELEQLAGRRLVDDASIVDASRHLLERGGVGTLVVSLGPRGAVLVPRDHNVRWITAPSIGPAASTVGCGDAMVAGIVAALVDGRDLVDAARWGVAAGTATAATDGTNFFDRVDFDRLLLEVE